MYAPVSVDAERRLPRYLEFFEQLNLFPIDEERVDIDGQSLIEQVRAYADLVVRRLIGLVLSLDTCGCARRQVVRAARPIAGREPRVHHGVAAHVPAWRNRVGKVMVRR